MIAETSVRLAQASQEWIERYHRQLMMPDIGYEGQKKLACGRVLIVGLGGLGAPASLYLAGAGIGTIGIVDDGVVELSNLHRQILYTNADIGRRKVEVATERLSAFNPEISVIPIVQRLTPENAPALFRSYDIIVDGSDNFETRYILNDIAYFERKPWVYASLYRSYGQLSLFYPPDSPCYRCLYPDIPSGVVPDCSQAGVVGPLPGVLGAMQAMEVIKWLVGFGEHATGWLVHIDLHALEMSRLQVRRRPACPLCGDYPVITKAEIGVAGAGVPAGCVSGNVSEPTPVRHQHYGGGTAVPAASPGDALEVEPALVARWIASGEPSIVLLDVREDKEVRFCRLPGSVWIPLALLPLRFSELDARSTVIVYCHTGSRSYLAAQWLRDHGFMRAYSLAGGIDRWSAEIDPAIPRY